MKLAIFIFVSLTGILNSKAQETDTLKSSAPDTAVYVSPEHPAEFPGGRPQLGHFLAMTIRYPRGAYLNHIQGRVVVQMIIERDGRLSHVVVIRSVSRLLDQEAIRVVSSSPKWVPATQNGKPVRMLYALPILFKVDPEMH